MDHPETSSSSIGVVGHGEAEAGTGWGVAALTAGGVVLFAAVVSIVVNSAAPFPTENHRTDQFAAFGAAIQLVPAVLGLAAQLIDGPIGRRFGRYALVVWVIADMLAAVQSQRALGQAFDHIS